MREFVAGLCLLWSSLLLCCIHRVPEGHVVYFHGGALSKRVDGPGFRFAMPVVTRVVDVKTTVQTDKVIDIPCGTKGGTIIMSKRIEVVNFLDAKYVYETVKNYTVNYDKLWIYDKIHHEINQICSQRSLEDMYIHKFETLDDSLVETLQRDIAQNAMAIKILNICVTKPTVPAFNRQNYEMQESERTKLKVAEQTGMLMEREAETARKRAIIKAQELSEVSEIRRQKQKETEKALARIENKIYQDRKEAKTDAEFYKATHQTRANKVLFTPLYVKAKGRAIGNSTKMYWGDRLPMIAM